MTAVDNSGYSYNYFIYLWSIKQAELGQPNLPMRIDIFRLLADFVLQVFELNLKALISPVNG